MLWLLGVAAPAAAQAQGQGQQRAAQSPEADREAYLSLIRKAVKEYDLGNWSEARTFFARAHKLSPNARTLRGLGLASYELRSYVEAIGFLRAALEDQRRPLTEEMRDQVRELLEQAQSFVARYRLELTPDNAQLRVDGADPVRDAEGWLMLDAGAHEVVARVEGYESVTRRVVARGNTRETLTIELRKRVDDNTANLERVATAAPGSPSDSRQEGFFATRTTQQWVGMGAAAVGVAGLAVSGAFSVIAMGKNSDSEADCEGNRCNPEGLELRNEARDAGTVATVSAIAGGALLAGGVVLYLTGGPSDERPAPRAASLSLHPEIGPGRWALGLRGRFP